MDPQGFVEVDQLVEALRNRSWPHLTVDELIEALDAPDVDRFERRDTVVRATYGHSVEVDLEYAEIRPEFPLFHGTTPEAWSSIKREGLKAMSRQYVHLSNSVEDAFRVGRRHTSDPVILQIEDGPEQKETGFYRAGPVVLTEYVPPGWIEEFDSSN